MASLLGTINTLNRLLCLSSLVYALYALSQNPSPRSARSIGGLWKYWTNWTAVTLIFFYFLALLCEIFSYLKYRIDDFSHRALIYHGFVVPMGVSVFSSFWALTLVDPELVVPPEAKAYLPDHINHILHTLIFPGLLVEGFTYFHPLPSRKAGIRSVVLSHGAYFAFVLYCGFYQGTWIYPFLAMMSLPLIITFGIVQLSVSCGVYILFEKLHQIIWASELKED